MVRLMGGGLFRNGQMQDRYASHVAPINRLVDDAFGRPDLGWMPYVAPLHGGTQARVLSVLRDPGPKVRQSADHEHGFLCIENDDPTAEAQATLFESVGISPSDVTPWNAYPWYINAAPRAAQLHLGLEPLFRVLELLSQPSVLLLQGGHAQTTGRKFDKRWPGYLDSRGIKVVTTYHPGRQALWHKDSDVRESRLDDRLRAYRRVAELL